MSLVPMKELLQDASAQGYAVGGFNVFNFETLTAVTEVAEELKAPLVIGVPERLFTFVDAETLCTSVVRVAKRACVPIAIHLDHGYTFEGIMKALRWGFTSVMFDGSALSFEENVKKTKEIAKIAHSLGVSVEGELGYLCSYGESLCNLAEENLFKPEKVAEYVERTKVDALAVGVGNNHGMYRGKPKLDFGRVQELKTTVQVPLVLHGGSKLTKADFQQGIVRGIAKVNIATDMFVAATETLKKELDVNPNIHYVNLMGTVKKGVKEAVKKYLLAFGCINKGKK
jgi:fructose-bisphosphate aldolase, class II